jgi:hypothetical protein
MVGRTSEGDDIAQSSGARGFQLYGCDDIIDFATFSVELMRNDGVMFCEVLSMTSEVVWYLWEYEG